MPYTIGRLMEDFRTICGEANSDWWGAKAKQTLEEALTIFLTSRWPFNEGEGVVTTVAPYTTGTVAVVQGVQAIVGTGTTWNTNWITPAVIRIEGSGGDAMLVNSFDSTTGLTLDVPWPYASDASATYSIEFPAHAIGSYISVTGVSEARLSSMVDLRPASFEDMLYRRPWMPHSSWPGQWAVIPADGTLGQKLWVWPPPAEIQTLRFRYVKAVPAFRYYRTGVASVTNTNINVTGSGTLWAKQGYSMAGQYLEMLAQPGHQVLIASVTNDTALVLTTGGYTGATEAGGPYAISPAILCPDDLKPLLRAICRWKYHQDAMPAMAPDSERRYIQLRDQAISRYNISRDATPVQPIWMHDVDWSGPPAMPSILRIE